MKTKELRIKKQIIKKFESFVREKTKELRNKLVYIDILGFCFICFDYIFKQSHTLTHT